MLESVRAPVARSTESVSELLTKIRDGALVLPDLQREFVWSESKVCDLANSIYKDYPIGIVILWEAGDAGVPTVLLDDAPDANRIQALVLDGQQRLSSLKLLIDGSLTPQRGAARTCNVYFDSIEGTFKVGDPSLKNRAGVYFVPDLIRELHAKLADPRRLKKQLGIKDRDVYDMHSKMERAKARLIGYQIPIHTVPKAVTYEDAAEIFLKVNSRGTKIRATELLLALLSAKVPRKLKDDVYDLVDELEEEGWKELDIPVLIRVLFGIGQGKARLRSSSIQQAIAKWPEADILSAWTKARKGTMEVVDLLQKKLGLAGDKWVPSYLALVPMAVFLGLRNQKYTPAEADELVLWFILSSLVARYTGTTEPRLEADLAVIHDEDSVPLLVKQLCEHLPDLKVAEATITGRSDPLILALYAVEQKLGAADWSKGAPIRGSDFEVHHIFPKALLRKNGITESAVVNDVANFTLITSKANKEIRSKEPAVYLPKLEAQKRLNGHVIPSDPNLWTVSRYSDFLAERRRLLVNEVNAYLNSLGAARSLAASPKTH